MRKDSKNQMLVNRAKKSFFKILITLALPLALQNLITSFVSLVDNVMIGQLGDEAIAAVGLANQFFFVYSLFIFGTSSGGAVFISQYYGKKDFTGIRNIIGIQMAVSLAAGIICGGAALFMPGLIMKFFTPDMAVQISGVGYLKIVAITFPLSAISLSVSYILKSIGEVKIPVFASALSVMLNIVFNYLLIYGKFGFPYLGVNGAAIATLISRFVEAIVITGAAFYRVDFLREKIRDYVSFSKEKIKSFFVIAGPVIINESLWALGMTVYSAVYSRIGGVEAGTAAVAAANTASLAEKLVFVGSMGFSHAAGIIVGKSIGAKKNRYAIYAANFSAIVTPVVSLAATAILIILTPIYLNLFVLTPMARDMAQKMLYILALSVPLKSYSLLGIVGVLRGGGDTKFALFVDVLTVWMIGVPVAYLSGIVIGFSAPLTYALVLSEEVVKCIIVYVRMSRKKWINDLVN